MKEESWMMIVAALIPIIWETVRNWYRSRKSLSKDNQELEKPKSWRGWIKSWLGSRLISYIISISSILLNAIFLINELSQTTPITRHTIFNISVYTGGIFLQLILILIFGLLYLSDRRDKIILNYLNEYNDLLYKIMGLQEKFSSLASNQLSVIEDLSIIEGLPIEINREEPNKKEPSIC